MRGAVNERGCQRRGTTHVLVDGKHLGVEQDVSLQLREPSAALERRGRRAHARLVWHTDLVAHDVLDAVACKLATAAVAHPHGRLAVGAPARDHHGACATS